jgi:signal transduction histidine kinase
MIEEIADTEIPAHQSRTYRPTTPRSALAEAMDRRGLQGLFGISLVCSALIALLWFSVPHPEGAHLIGFGASDFVLATVGVVLFAHRKRSGATSLNVGLAAVSVATSGIFVSSGRPGGYFVLLYVVSIPFAFLALELSRTAAQGIFTAICMGVATALRPAVGRAGLAVPSIVTVVIFGLVCVLVDGVARAVTKLQESEARKERRLAESQRIEGLSDLARGTAHDLNNLLSVILNYSGFAIDAAGEGSTVRTDVEQIRRAAASGTAFSRRLAEFARPVVIDPTPTSLNEAVSDAVDRLSEVVGHEIELTSELDATAGAVLVDREGIERVLLHLVTNARDAMPRGGSVVITTASATLNSADVARRPGLVPGRHVRLQVRDTGVGMDGEVVRRAFEPFFTTRPGGQGAGLGLATVLGIIVRHNGWAELDSEVGVGTTFTAFFPVASTTGPPTPPGTCIRGVGDRWRSAPTA